MEQPENDFDGLFDDLLLFESEDHPNVINDIQLGGGKLNHWEFICIQRFFRYSMER
jgi:hypothetical protein